MVSLRRRKFWVSFIVVCLCATPAFCAGDSQARTIATAAVSALTGKLSLNDLTLSASVTWSDGSGDQTGTSVLVADATQSTRVEIILNGSKRVDVLNNANGSPVAAWSTDDAVAKAYPVHNSMVGAGWFFPAFGPLADPNSSLSYLGVETRDGVAVHHLRSAQFNKWVAPSTEWSATDFYIDSTTFFPVALSFNIHADDDSSVNIPVEVRFSKYQTSNGIQVPTHIEKYINFALVLQLDVTGVVVNSNPPITTFSLQ